MKKMKRKLGFSAVPTAKKAIPLKLMDNGIIPSELDLSDSEEDTGRLEAQDFLMEAVAKRKTAIKNDSHTAKFRAIVEQRKLSLLQLLSRMKEETSSQRISSKASLNSIFTTVLSSATTSASEAVGNRSKPKSSLASNSTLHQKSRSIIFGSKEVIRKYDTVTQNLFIEEESLQLGQKWNSDSQELLNLLEIGKKAVKEDVRQLMMPGGEGSQAKAQNNLQSLSDVSVGADFYVAREKYNIGDSWAVAARRTRKDIQRLMKHIHDT